MEFQGWLDYLSSGVIALFGCSADELGFTLDTYWVQYGGGNPAEWIERLSGRVPCIHLKDYAYDQKMAVIGEGNINFDKVFEKAEKAGHYSAYISSGNVGHEGGKLLAIKSVEEINKMFE